MDFLMEITDQNPIFTENQNGPYGPQEPFLQDGIAHLGLKKGVMEENWKNRGIEKLKIEF